MASQNTALQSTSAAVSSLVSGLTLFFPYVGALGFFGSKRTIIDRLTGTILIHVLQQQEGEL